MKTVSYKVPNISCGHCVHTIKMEVEDIQGVESVDATVADQTVIVNFDDPATEKQIIEVMTEIYYPPAAV